MLKLDIQRFANPKLVIETDLNTKNFENGLNKIKNTTQRAGSTIKNIVVGLGITKAISVAMNQITGSIDGAVSRLDALNQFPKVMENLGISAEESQEAISKMSDKLSGLPTTLDDGARAVQRFTSKNGNVKKSTDLFLALNNAILAGGASSEIQASALEQLSQSYAKGKPDMMEWRTAMTAMPAQLKQVARAMGYVDADQLGEALREGTVSMDDFMDTISRLNTEGVDGFLSFEKQAKNSTGGIKTSITVAKTQVVKGVADIINALNTKISGSGAGGVGDVIAKIGENAKTGLDFIAKLIKGDAKALIIGSLENLENTGPEIIKKITDGITLKLPNLLNTAGDIIQQFISTINANIPQIFESGVTLITTFINGISDQLPKLIPQLLETVITLFSAISESKNIDKVTEAGGKLVLKLIEGIIASLPTLIENSNFLLNAFVNVLSGGQYLMRKVGWSLMKALIITIKQAISDMVNVGVQLIEGLWNGIKQGLANLKAKFPNAVQGIVDLVKRKLKIHSPSLVFKNEIGKQMSAGLGIGFEEGIKDVYRRMAKAINFEQSKLQASVETGKVFNTLANTTPVAINVNADVEMDSQKVGRLITPEISRTIKSGGGY